jgi:hypothetical protein
MPKDDLEARLAALTQTFVAQLVDVIRNASFAEVAALPGAGGAISPRPPARGPAAAAKTQNGAPRRRRSAAGLAELQNRLVAALSNAGKSLGVRDLSDALGVKPEALAAALRDLRAAGRIKKHGDKRATKYSAH